VKHFFFIAVFSICNHLCPAQSELPWELERFGRAHYESSEEELETKLDSEESFGRYYKEYKAKRAENPGEYFLAPTPFQEGLKESLIQTDSPSELLLLANFLESGTESALNELADSPYQNSATLPYRFAAAMSEMNSEKASFHLAQMNEHGMISSILKAWGLNAASNMNQNIYMTHGLQDLIGLCWALSESNRLSGVIIYNKYLNGITHKSKGEGDFLKAHPSAWISPTYNSEFLDQNIKDFRLSGIGFKLANSAGNPESEFNATVEGFSGMNLECPTPADAGLVSSYTYFLNQVEFLVEKGNRAELKSFANQLANYIEKSTIAK
jgi:hypothetical protein